MRALLVLGLVFLLSFSGCVRRVVTAPPDMGAPPADAPPNAVGVHFDSDRDGRRWQVLAGTQPPCVMPCSMWLDPTQTVHLQSNAGEGLYLDALDLELQGAKHGVVIASGRNRGEHVNGLVFTTLGAMGLVVGITLAAVGCSDTQRRAGMCTAGLITGGLSAPLMAAAIWMIIDSAPKAHFFPVFSTAPMRGAPVSVVVTPTGLVGKF